MDSKILVSTIFAVSCVIGFCVVLSFIIYKDKNSDDNSNDNKPTSTNPTSKTNNIDPAEPTITTPTANGIIGGNDETNTNQADSIDKKSQESSAESNDIPPQESLNGQLTKSTDNLQPNLSQSDLIITDCEKCKQNEPQTGEKICEDCKIKSAKKTKKDVRKGGKPHQGNQINQNIVTPGSETVHRIIDEPQPKTNSTDNGTGNSTIEERKIITGSEEGPIDRTNKSQQDERIISGKKDQELDAKLIDQQSGNAGDKTIKANEEINEGQPTVDNTNKQGSAIEGSNASQNKTLPASNQNQQQRQPNPSNNQTKEYLTQTELKNKFDLILVADHPRFYIKTSNITPGIYQQIPTEENKKVNDIFIIKELVVGDKKEKILSRLKINECSSQAMDESKSKNFIKDLFIKYQHLYDNDEIRFEKHRSAFYEFVMYLRSNFFKKSKGSVEVNGVNHDYDKKNVKNVLIFNTKKRSVLLFKREDYFYDVEQLLKIFFSQKRIKNPEFINIIFIFIEVFDNIFDPILNRFNENKFLTDKDGNEFYDSVKKFLILFYDENFDETSKFDLEIEINESSA